MGMQLHLQALLSPYRFFASALISVSLPVRKKIYFKNSETPWKMGVLAMKRRNQGSSPEPLKLMLGPACVRPLKKMLIGGSVTAAAFSDGLSAKQLSAASVY
ncbi:centromere protein I-like isoform X1 [Trachypithecus francoisi]|uniref:centromere protein I-like isoform X1 n=1 Tax=Trachypithecus francoisi TaxID=54180 RepID=UPI00141B97F6|nr:centromere protein I-like isoform X1 [Trachypithecus francoisi]